MEKETIQEYQVKYFKDINRAVDVQQLVNLIQYGANGKDDKRDFVERQKAAWKRLVNSIKMRGCNTEEIVSEFEKYGKMVQITYFQIGVQIGICLQAELLLNQDKIKEKEKAVMKTTEFKEYLFDVINEGEEPMFREVTVDERTGKS